MKIHVLLVALVAGLLACQQHANPAEEQEKIKQVLIGYFEGISTKDFAKMDALCTDDYVLFESGMVWNNDSLANNVKKFPGRLQFRFDSFNVRADRESGRMTYFNHGDLYVNDSLKQSFDWVESATFRKEDGQWKLEFLHSTGRK